MSSIRIGTRTSKLAMWQTQHIAALISAADPTRTVEIVPFVTKGDKTQAAGKPLPEIGGKGLFTLELEQSLLSGDIDLAVHSLKDLPVEDPAGLCLGAIVGRADVRDVLITRSGGPLAALTAGMTVGTSSLRRQAQLLAQRPDLRVQSIRGNVDTRIKKTLATDGPYDAVILAAAGVDRLALDDHISERLDLDWMLPAPGQAAIGVQCRADDAITLAVLGQIDCGDVRSCVSAERAFLHGLSGGCSTPVAAHATLTDGTIQLKGRVLSADGTQQVAVSDSGSDPIALGERMANAALQQGALGLLGLETPSTIGGKRIIVTRSEQQAHKLVNKLTQRGATAIPFPVIRFEPLPAPTLATEVSSLREDDWLVFTSVNAVDYFNASHPLNQLPPCKLAAVGSASCAALEAFGLTIDLIPSIFSGEQLAHELGDLSGKRVLLPRTKAGRPEIVNRLRAKGGDVVDIALYDTVQASPSAESYATLAQGYDMVTFTSPSSVRNFFDLVDEVPDVDFATIGPSTSAELRTFGRIPTIEATPFTIEQMVEAITIFYGMEEPVIRNP